MTPPDFAAPSPDGLPAGSGAPLDYEQARQTARDPRPDVRAAVAAMAGVAPEILYFLAEDPEAVVRRAVAGNPEAPAKANLLLAEDVDDGVRTILAAKVADLERDGRMPAGARARSITAEALDRLSQDRLAAVRAAVADGLKDLPSADPALVRRLARDVEILVAAPILEHSPVLAEEDLLEIIRSNPIAGALAAIARRAYVGPEITDAIVASGDRRAVTHLLYNARSQLQEHTLDSLIGTADQEPDWQVPLARRPDLPESSVRRLAEMVADHVLGRLADRGDLSPEAAVHVRQVINERLETRLADGAAALPSPYAAQTADRFAPHLERARDQQARGALTEEALMVALLTDRPDDLVAGLSVRSQLPVTVVLEILASQAPRPVTALAHAAGLSPRFAVELQVKLGRIAPDSCLKPTAEGGWPMTEPELRWHIEMYVEH